jgi:dTDP-4-amino-4,6-dideoxygalactose transaminase
VTDDAALAEALRELRNHGQAAPGQFARASGNHRLSEVAAALGIVQLRRLDGMLEQRRALAATYTAALTEYAVQRAPEGALRNHQTYGMLVPPRSDRDAAVQALRERGVESGRLSYALHSLPQLSAAARQAELAGRTFPNATAIAARGLALPLWPGLSEADQRKVLESLRAVLA